MNSEFLCEMLNKKIINCIRNEMKEQYGMLLWAAAAQRQRCRSLCVLQEHQHNKFY